MRIAMHKTKVLPNSAQILIIRLFYVTLAPFPTSSSSKDNFIRKVSQVSGHRPGTVLNIVIQTPEGPGSRGP